MKKAFFSFLLVLGFLPVFLYSLQLNARAVSKVETEKTLLMEQQVITNREQEFEDTFWEVTISTVRNKENLDYNLGKWKRVMAGRGIKVWAGRIEFPYYSSPPPSGFENLVEVSPDKTTVELKKSYTPYAGVGATITAGNSTGIYLIPVGCYREL